MCSHYEAVTHDARLKRWFGCEAPANAGVTDVWPVYKALFVRRPREADAGDEAVPEREALLGQFGLVPHWAKDEKFGRRTFNARRETAATLPSFRDAWRKGYRCIIPAEAIYEPDWRSGKAVATRITRADGQPMGIAGLWSWWKSPAGEELLSFAMLTINAQEHSLMRNFHKPGDEKRMVVILPAERFTDWLVAKPDDAMEFMRQLPAEAMQSAANAPPAT